MPYYRITARTNVRHNYVGNVRAASLEDAIKLAQNPDTMMDNPDFTHTITDDHEVISVAVAPLEDFEVQFERHVGYGLCVRVQASSAEEASEIARVPENPIWVLNYDDVSHQHTEELP